MTSGLQKMLSGGSMSSLPVLDCVSGSRSDDGSWHPVPRFMIRSAGFNFAYADLRHRPLVEALAQRRALRALVDALRTQWQDTHFPTAVAQLEAAGAERTAFKSLYRCRNDLGRNRPLQLEAATPSSEWRQRWNDVLDQLAASEQQVDVEVAEAVKTGQTVLRSLLDDARFVAAITASNPDAAARIRRSLCSDAAGRRSATRQDERVLYGYAQRLATKNETTSFFGPIDYGRLSASMSGEAVQLRYADQPVQTSLIRLSHWAVQALADRIAADPAIADLLPLRLHDGFWFDGTHLVIATTDRRIALGGTHATVLRAISSGRPPRLADLCEDQARAARTLLARKVIAAELVVPAALDDPADWLYRSLDELDGAAMMAVRQVWRGVLDGLTTGCGALVCARPDEREPLLRVVERQFSTATGLPARRGSGHHYADRLVITEDCRGGVAECVVATAGTEILVRRLSAPLTLCASFSVLVQRAVLRRAITLHRRLGGGPMRYLRFVAELDRNQPMSDVLADPEITDWLDQLDALVREAAVDGVATLAPADLAPLLCALPDGTLVSPDIFFTDDPATPGRSLADAGLVVGEIHHGIQVWTHLSALDPELERTSCEVADALRADDPAMASMLHRRTQGKAFERETTGTAIEFRTRAALHHPRTLPTESLQVHELSSGLRLTDATGRTLQLRPRHPRSASNWLFGTPPVIAPTPLRSAAVAPRVLVGDVVAWRRRWTLPGTAVQRLTTTAELPALVRVSDELIAELGLPELVFARNPIARKPVFADLRCPTSLRYLAHYLRGADTADLVEMLPTPDQWWLRPGSAPVSCEWRLTLSWRTGDLGAAGVLGRADEGE